MPDSNAPTPHSDRRNFKRYRLWFPVTLQQADAQIWGICRDAGSGGLLVATTRPLDVGAQLSGRFRTAPEVEDRPFDARVVRCGASEDEMLLAFPFRVALAFLRPDDKLEELLKHAEAD